MLEECRQRNGEVAYISNDTALSIPRSFACLSTASLASSSAWPERVIHLFRNKKLTTTNGSPECWNSCSKVAQRYSRQAPASVNRALPRSDGVVYSKHIQGIPCKSGHELSPKRGLYVPRSFWQKLPVEDRAPSQDGTGQALKMLDMPMHLRLQVRWYVEYLCDRQHCRACMTTRCVERQRLEVHSVAGWIDQCHIRALCCNRKHTAIAQPEFVLLRNSVESGRTAYPERNDVAFGP